MHADEPMPPEIEALATLPREREPAPELEEQVVTELTRRGVLGPRRRTVIELTGRRLAGVAAAVAVLIMSGFAMGYLAGTWRAGGGLAAGSESDGFLLAARVQHAGGEYLAALQDLAAHGQILSAEEREQGREVALATLGSAAGAITGLAPQDEILRQLLTVALRPPTHVLPVSEGRLNVEF